MRRRDFWLGVLVLAAALVAHAMLPRHDVVGCEREGLTATCIMRDRWTGELELRGGAPSTNGRFVRLQPPVVQPITEQELRERLRQARAR